MYSQATVSAVLVVTGRLVNSVFWDLSRTCHLGLVPVETWLQLEESVKPEPLWMGQTITLSQQCERCSARRKSHTRTLCGWGRPTELVGVQCVLTTAFATQNVGEHTLNGKGPSWGAPPKGGARRD